MAPAPGLQECVDRMLSRSALRIVWIVSDRDLTQVSYRVTQWKRRGCSQTWVVLKAQSMSSGLGFSPHVVPLFGFVLD